MPIFTTRVHISNFVKEAKYIHGVPRINEVTREPEYIKKFAFGENKGIEFFLKALWVKSYTTAGFFFHACLLLVLSRWKPSTDDSALFYVIAGCWGACNAMWETLQFALITLTHTSHVIEVTSPLQALRYLGLAVTFAAHGFLCENVKILVLVILLVITVLPYGILEVRLEGQRKNQKDKL